MAGKRHSGSLEHMFYHKMSRVEMAQQHSIPCTGKTIAKDLQACKNVFPYPLSGSEGQHSYNPWNSATAYVQYAGNALNQHLQSGVSHCQRSENKRINNPSQLSGNASGQYSAHQHPVHNYHMSPSRAYPSIAVPSPVYASPTTFIDPAYQTRDFQTMGVHVGSQSLCTPPVEWSSSSHFPYSSTPFYVSGTKSLHQAPNGYLEANGGLSSHPRSVQELGPVHRHRTDTSTSVGSSASCYQDDVFRDRIHSFAQQNMQLLCAESSVSAGKPRNSAFAAPTQEHYKCTAYQGSPDTRMGHAYSKPYCDSAMDSYHQRSALYSSNVAKSASPLSIHGSTNYEAQKLHMGYVNQDSRALTQFDDGTRVRQSQAELEIQFSSTSRTSRETQMCSGQRDKASLFGPGPMNKDVCVNPANVNNEHVLSSARVSNNLHETAFYEKCITEKSPQNSFPQQNPSFNKLPAAMTKNITTNKPDRENTLISKLPTSPRSLHNVNDRRHGDRTEGVNTTNYKQPSRNRSQANDTANTDCTVASSGTIYQSEKSNDNRTSCHESQVEQISGSALPQASEVDADGPQSPPMPVINDVFSLAPYRAYLEGKAPHPFPILKESEVQNGASTSSVSQQSCSTEKAGEMEKDALKLETIPAVVKSECHVSESTHQKANAQSNESLDANSSNGAMDAEVLDLSLKRSVQTSCSTPEQLNLSLSSHKPSSKLVTERNLSRVSEDVSTKDQESSLSQVTKMMPNSEKKLHRSHTTVITSSPRKENYSSQATEKTTCLSQESFTTAKSYICQSQDISESRSHETQELQRINLCQATKSLTHEKHAKHSLHASKNVPSSVHDNNSYQAIQIQPIYTKEQCNSQIHLSQQMDRKFTSQPSQNITPHVQSHCQSQDVGSKPDKPIEKSYDTKWTYNAAVETQAKNLQETYTSQTPKTPPLQQICSSQTTGEVARNIYYGSISAPPQTYSVQSSQSTNISLFVNTIQTPTSFFPQAIFFTSPAAVLCPQNKLPIPKHQSPSPAATERRARRSVDSSETSLSGSENEGNGFHSSKAFMMRKYKMRRLSTSGTEDQDTNNSSSHAMPRPFQQLSDAAHSLPPSAPESSPTLGEANVSLASADEVAPNGSGKQFSELHRLVRSAITSSVARSPSNFLKEWLEKTKDPERGKTSAKAKSGSRPNDLLAELPARDIWQDFEGVRLRLHKLLSQLETFMFTRSCPFPHVIRAGAIFIPIYLVREVLFPELGTSVDRVLQKHKVELRPTTLSEERLLRETELKDCPSRMLKLLALKQLPDVYPDLLHLFCEQTIQNHLGSCPTQHLEESEFQESSPSKEGETASPRKGRAPLIMRLQRVCNSPGSQVYKALQVRPLEKRNTEKIPVRKVCRKKSYKDKTLMTYKHRRRRVKSQCSTNEGFPNLVGKRILHLFDDGESETWFPGKVIRVHRHSYNPQDTQYEVWYDSEPGTSYFLELLQDYERGWLKLDT